MLTKYRDTLVYDDSCPFCNWLAHLLADHYKVNICAASQCRKFAGIPKASLLRDVHFVREINFSRGRSYMVYVGADAAAKVISIQHPWFNGLYNFPPVHWIFKNLYFVLKKIRKYLHIVL